MNILGFVIFCVDNVGGHRYFCGSYTLLSFHYGNVGLVIHSGVIVKLPSNKG